jgi:CheY-like chemotaxis protein
VSGASSGDDRNSEASALLGLRAFIADDEPLLLMLLADLMTELGCKVVGSASSVDQGLQRAKPQDLDVAVLDVKLDRDIAPLVEALNERGVPVVLATGYDPAEIARRFPRSLVLRKPYSLASLRPVLMQVLGGTKRT